jgi:proteasome assembly chaperone (PAC2) family protein
MNDPMTVNHEEISYSETPTLDRPCMILGFEGWPNAAEVSSLALSQSVDLLKARPFAELSPELFYEFTTLRPAGRILEGRLVDLRLPRNQFYYSTGAASRDVILFLGVEPHLRWATYTDLLIGVARKFGVAEICSLGGTYDTVPHTRPPVVSAVCGGEGLREKALQAGLALTGYEGPVSIHSFIMEKASREGFPTMSLWGHAPHYLQTRNTKVALSLMRRLSGLLNLNLDLSEMRKASALFEQQVQQFVDHDPKLREIVRRIEEAYAQEVPFAGRGGDAKEEKVVYLRGFLKRQEDRENHDE